MPPSNRQPIPVFGLLVALLGAVFCAYQAGPWFETWCPTNGCRVFSDLTVMGISLWWIGCAAYSVLALLCLARQRSLAAMVAGIGLVIDCVLLVIMVFVAPCAACLVAAVGFAAMYALLRETPRSATQPHRLSWLLLFWLLLFVANALAVAAEEMEPWTVAGSEQADRIVYVSPSCAACREAVAAMDGRADFVLVAKDEADIRSIVRLQARLDAGEAFAPAFAASLEGPDPVLSLTETIALRFRLLRNSAALNRIGSEVVPTIILKGMPSAAGTRPVQAAAPSHTRPAQTGGEDVLPPELRDPLEQCNRDAEPCDP